MDILRWLKHSILLLGFVFVIYALDYLNAMINSTII